MIEHQNAPAKVPLVKMPLGKMPLAIAMREFAARRKTEPGCGIPD